MAAPPGNLPLARSQTQLLRGHRGPVQALKFNKDGNYCISGGNDKTIALWNPYKSAQIRVFKGHSYEILDLDVAVDNTRIISCGEDKQVFLWDVAEGRIIRRLKGHASRVNCVKFTADNSAAVTASYDRTVKIWDLRSHNVEPIQILDDAKDSVMSIAVSGHEILAGSVDGCVRCYDIREGRLRTDHMGHPVTSVSFSNDGNCILASCLDSALRLLDKSTGELLGEYVGHTNKNYKIDSMLTRNDAYVVSGSEDGRICFWDLVEMKMVHALKGHMGAVQAIALHPTETNRAVLSSGVDGTIRLWT